MLVLTRKVGQKVKIGDGVTVVVGRILPGVRVRLCIEAPPSVRVDRAELPQKCQSST